MATKFLKVKNIAAVNTCWTKIQTLMPSYLGNAHIVILHSSSENSFQVVNIMGGCIM